MMTEQDYINTTTLARCMTLTNVLRDMAPEIVPCIDDEEYRQVAGIVYDWQEGLFAAVHESRQGDGGP